MRLEDSDWMGWTAGRGRDEGLGGGGNMLGMSMVYMELPFVSLDVVVWPE